MFLTKLLAQSQEQCMLIMNLGRSSQPPVFELLYQTKEAHTCRAEERRRKLREAAEATANTGTDTEPFEQSQYSLSEESRTPNIHSRQGEGAKSQINV